MHIVLLEPEIPPNTGNVARLCAATRSTLHLIEPFGFKLEDRELKRAGMDYWQQVNWKRWKNWQEFEASVVAGILPAVEPGILPGGTGADSQPASQFPNAPIGIDLEFGSSGRESAPSEFKDKLEPTHVGCYGAGIGSPNPGSPEHHPNPGGKMPDATQPPRLWFIEQGGSKLYTEATFGPDDYLVFGRETAGLPKALLEQHRETWLRIPMFNPDARSLNLSNCVSLVLFEALRQQGFPGGEKEGRRRNSGKDNSVH